MELMLTFMTCISVVLMAIVFAFFLAGMYIVMIGVLRVFDVDTSKIEYVVNTAKTKFVWWD